MYLTVRCCVALFCVFQFVPARVLFPRWMPALLLHVYCCQVGEYCISPFSRSYAEDVTSVTSGASQGPHSFNLVIINLLVCLFVSRLALSRICPVPYRTIKHSWPQTAGHNICWLPYLSRTVPYHQTQLATNSWSQYSSYYVYDSLMYRETFWKEIGRRGGNAIRMDVSCRIGDRMRQQKHTLEERSRRLQNKRERASQRLSQETSEERSRRLQNARDRQSQRRSQETSGQTSHRLQNARDRQSQRRSQEIFPSVLTTCTMS